MLLEPSVHMPFKRILFLILFSFLLFNSFFAQHDKQFSAVYSKAQAFLERGQKDSADHYFQKLTGYTPGALHDSLYGKLYDVYFKGYRRTFEKNQLKEAAHFIIACIKLASAHTDTARMIKAHNANAEIYRAIKNFPSALDEARLAIHLAMLSQKTDRLLYDAYISCSAVFIDERTKTGIDSSIYFLEKTIPLVVAAGDSSTLAQCYNNLAVNEQRKLELPKALMYYKKALEIHTAGKNHYPVLLCNSNIAQVMCDAKNYKDAVKQAYYTLGLFNGDEQITVHTELQLSLARSYLHLNQPDSAEKYFERFFEGSFMLAQEEQNSVINELNKKYRVEEKEKDIAILKKNAELQVEESKRKQLVIYFFIGVSLVLAFAVYFAVKSYRTKKRANITIMQQKLEVERQKQVVEEKQKEILDSIHYAKRIQQSLLTSEKYIHKTLGKLRK